MRDALTKLTVIGGVVLPSLVSFGAWLACPPVTTPMISYDTDCHIATTGWANRLAKVQAGGFDPCDEQDDDVSLASDSADYAAAGLNYSKTFPTANNDSHADCQDVGGVDCFDFDASADVKIETDVEVLANTKNITVEINTTSLASPHFSTFHIRGGMNGGMLPVSPEAPSCSYNIPRRSDNSERFRVEVPFTIAKAARKIRVCTNELSRTETGTLLFFRTGSIEWWIYKEDTENNCEPSTTLIASGATDDLTQTGDGTDTGITNINLLPAAVDRDVVLVVEYRTNNELLDGLTECGKTSDQTSTLVETFTLKIQPEF